MCLLIVSLSYTDFACIVLFTGMFIAGCILRNVPAINVAANIDPHLADIIR